MQGNVAIVAFGTGGMGRAMCERLARHRAKLAVTDLKAAAAQRITAALGAAADPTIAMEVPGILFDPDAT